MIPNLTEKRPSQTFSPLPAGRAVPSPSGQFHRPTHEQIARCAYDIYIEHGRAEGRSELDWRQAEEELAHASAASAP
jgi:hypothetical protein